MVARRRLAARNLRPPLLVRCVVALGGLDPADVGAARRRVLRLPLGAYLTGLRGRRGPGPWAPGPRLVAGSSSFRPGLVAAQAANGHSHRMFCCCLPLRPFPFSNIEASPGSMLC